MGWKEKYAYSKLYKKAAARKRKPVLPHPDRIKQLAIVWQPSQEKAVQFIKSSFASSNTKITSICVVEEDSFPAGDACFISREQLNWWGLPKPEITSEFFSQQYDLLLNVALKQNLVLDYLTALAHASFKIGWAPDNPNFFDLNINIGEKQDALFLAEQQIFYLRQLNKKTIT